MSQRSKVLHHFKSIDVDFMTLQVSSAGNTKVMTHRESGDIVLLNSSSGSAITLPPPFAGLNYRFIVSNTGPHTITAPSACINGALSNSIFNTGANLATGDAKTVIATTAGSVIGDNINLIGAGTKYFLNGNVTNYNAINFS